MLTIRLSQPPHNMITGAFLEFEDIDFTIGVTQEDYAKVLRVDTLPNGQNILSYYQLRATISNQEAEQIRNLINKSK